MKRKSSSWQMGIITILFLSAGDRIFAQVDPLYENLPSAKYGVGFKIITLVDSNRIEKSEYNYLGERNEGDRSRTITLHLWYPAKRNSGTRQVKYGDYCYHHLLTRTNEALSDTKKREPINAWRNALERFLGKASDAKWNELINTLMLAEEDAVALPDKFPLIIGLMRPFTTAITNEFLASQGYTIAMLKKAEPGDDNWAKYARYEIPDMQFVISYLSREKKFDGNNIGTFGFSGAGFVPVLFAMHDKRVRALADIESLMYFEKDNLFQLFSASDYYNPADLRAPFLHIFGIESAKQEKFISEFESKTKFSKRYRLLLNQRDFSHGDFTMQGYAYRRIVKAGDPAQENITKSFVLATIYLLHFFNAELKADAEAKSFLSARPLLTEYQPELWDIKVWEAVKPAPNRDEFEYIIRKKGISEALTIVRNTLTNDSSTNITKGPVLNGLGYMFLSEKEYKAAIGVFELNVELHPQEANFFDSLAEGYELSGDKENMKRVSGKVIELLAKKATLTNSEKIMKEEAERRRRN